jgi:hypothetical protein
MNQFFNPQENAEKTSISARLFAFLVFFRGDYNGLRQPPLAVQQQVCAAPSGYRSVRVAVRLFAQFVSCLVFFAGPMNLPRFLMCSVSRV